MEGGGGALNACKVVCIIIIAKVMLTLALPDFIYWLALLHRISDALLAS